MTRRKTRAARGSSYLLAILALSAVASASARPAAPKPPNPAPTRKESANQDDSFARNAAKDLLLHADGERKAEALARFVEGVGFEESGEMDKALEAYRKVLNVDPGQAELACRVSALLTRQDEFPQAIDVLKDAIKANPRASAPYLQLAFIYAKYLRKNDQAIEYANRGIALDPTNIETYQRLYEIQIASGDDARALQSLERATKIKSDDPVYWLRLGKLFAASILKPDAQPKPEELARLNDIFKRATDRGGDNPAVLKEVADYYASSQQIGEAIPLYLRVLELQPDDANAQEKLATGFVLTNQRAKAIELLEEIIKQHPEKYQPYDLLAQVLDDQARALQRENKTTEAKALFVKAAANYEQSTLINPSHANTYLRLGDLLLGPIKDPERAVKVLTDARRRFPDAPEMIYYQAIALREAKHSQQAVITFEEALHASESDSAEMANARFYFDYGATAEQAGLYDKAADLFRKSIALDPANAADAYNYLSYMWAEQNMHLEEAADMISHALQNDPNNGAYLDTSGWIKFRQGKFEDALVDLQRAAENMKRDDGVVYEHIGDTYAQLNRIPQALEAWQKAITLDPQNKKVADKIDNAKTKMSKGNAPSPNPIQ